MPQSADPRRAIAPGAAPPLGLHYCEIQVTASPEFSRHQPLFRLTPPGAVRSLNWPMRPALIVWRLALVAGGAALATLAAPAESNLLEDSPFAPAGSTGNAAASPAPLELRSVVEEKGQYEFSLYDPARKESTWVTLNEPGHGFRVTNFDAARATVVVEQGGRRFPLTLKEVAIVPLDIRKSSDTAVVGPAEVVVRLGRQGQQLPPIPDKDPPGHPGLVARLRELRRQREAGILPSSPSSPVPPPAPSS